MILSLFLARPAALAALVALLLALVPAAAAAAHARQDPPLLLYRKVFPNSSPEYVEIRLHPNGEGTYDIRAIDDDPDPHPFTIRAELAAEMFRLAAEMDYFRELELDVRRRIANLGEKTFRYEHGGQANEVVFNYTLHRQGAQLLRVFEGLSRQFDHLERIQRRLRFDRLGIHQALLSLESDLNRGLLAEPSALAPLLEAIAEDPRIIEMARQRARALLERVRPLS